MISHLPAVASNEVVRSGGEQMLVIAPGGTDQRNAARERFEDPDRWYTRQRLHVWTSRDMQGYTVLRERLRHPIVREPAGIVDAGTGEPCDRSRGVPYPMHPSLETELFNGLDQELLELGRTLLIAPVPDPDHVASCLLRRSWIKDPGIGCLMPGPHSSRPPLAEIPLPDHFPKGQYPVVILQLVRRHAGRIGDRAVMRVMEEEPVLTTCGSVSADGIDQGMVVPFVHQHHVRALELSVQIERRQLVRGTRKRRIRPGEGCHRLSAVLLQEIFFAPGALRLVDAYLMASGLQLGGNSSKEMSVSVVPVRHQRVVEHHDAHAGSFARL